MHKEILTDEQIELLPLLKKFSKQFGLVGGTAIALHLGHRRSVDFDLFTDKKFSNASVRRVLTTNVKIDSVIRDEVGQYTLSAYGVRFTFFEYPFPISYSHRFQSTIRLPNLLTLAAMKAFALGRRAKWKDYVDLYFIMKDHHGLEEIIQKAKKLFKQEFNEKIFRIQLAYFADMNYSEEVIFLPGFEVDDRVIMKELVKFSLR
ncbi:MAG: nucleotidyl transferase AbiEii/AbiGii toxin family protein [Candidatus Kerfeldbacteria bacterium]|nr:nucleotidyl transferase AbiEii/AbiGii toxin family protein [Candidatus Kerfeldbacteria bacterium]